MFNFLFKKKEQPKILVFCGAGISQESGLQTFRDQNGLWTQHDLNEVCNLRTFHKNRYQVFDFYNQRKQDILSKEPNLAHYALAQLQQQYGKEHVSIFTSNIDNLLEKAGCVDVIHIHGDIYHMQCLDCSHTWFIGDNPYQPHDVCPTCQSSETKPGIIMFNEPAPKYKAFAKAFESSGIVKNKKIIPHTKLIIGTSFKVIALDKFYPARSRSILIDKNHSQLNGFHHIFNQPATEAIFLAYDMIKQWHKN